MRTVQGGASLRDITVIFDDRPIIRGLSLEISPGLTLVRGPNGAGKTTLLRVIAGMVPLAGGERRVGGESLYIGHRPMLLRGLTARENLSFYSRFRGLDGTAAVADALRAWGLDGKMDRTVERLSAGERRRAAMARVETERVPLLLLDEPFADLDEGGVARVRASVLSARDEGRTVVVATHGHPELDPLSALRIQMNEGMVTAA
jgi:heme exporter protein A